MFTVGEFSKLAQVSKRLLRYYDELGLLKPSQTDPATGYRYYSASQLSDLNRILVLKELGLSLTQIRRILQDNVSTDELQGMLLLKKAEIEQQLQSELQRIRNIEARLQSIRNAEANKPINVVIKSLPATYVLSVRTIVPTFEDGLDIFAQVRAAVPERNSTEWCFCISYDDCTVERDMDLEIGRIVQNHSNALMTLPNGLPLRAHELPPIETMATLVVTGALQDIHIGYGEIGLWAEANAYRLAGMAREITLQVPRARDGRDLITEIQYPIEKVSQT